MEARCLPLSLCLCLMDVYRNILGANPAVPFQLDRL